MKKLKDLKENECIRISSKREATGLAKQLNKQGFAKLNNSKFKAKWLFDSTHVYLSRKFDRFDLFEDASNVVYPALDFIRPSVKEQLRQLSDRVGKLEASGLPVVDEQHVKEYSVSEPYNRASVMQSKNEEEWVDICKGSRVTLDSKLAARKELTELPEKWAMKCRTEEQAAIFLPWVEANKQRTDAHNVGDLQHWFWSYPACSGLHYSSALFPCYTEITFEQFEKWVLNNPAATKSGELEVNKWYTNNNALFYVTALNKKDFFAYGFDYKGVWHNDSIGWGKRKNDGAVEAPHTEVEAALIGEANRRYKEGDVINSLHKSYGSENCKLIDFFECCNYTVQGKTNENDWRKNQSNPWLFKDGIWAEVIAAEPVIDWSDPALYSDEYGNVVLCSGDYKSTTFEGMVMNKENKMYGFGHFSSQWNQSAFKPFTGQITLNGKD